MTIIFYKTMITSQYKISYKTLLECYLLGGALLFNIEPTTIFFLGGGGTFFGYPLRSAVSAVYSMVPYIKT